MFITYIYNGVRYIRARLYLIPLYIYEIRLFVSLRSHELAPSAPQGAQWYIPLILRRIFRLLLRRALRRALRRIIRFLSGRAAGYFIPRPPRGSALGRVPVGRRRAAAPLRPLPKAEPLPICPQGGRPNYYEPWICGGFCGGHCGRLCASSVVAPRVI